MLGDTLYARYIGLLGKVGYENSAADERLLGVVLVPETHLAEESCFLKKTINVNISITSVQKN